MRRWLNSRYFQVVAIIVALMMVLFIRLFMLTVVENRKWVEAATDLSIKTIYTTAPRGEIKDRNGNVLAGNTYHPALRVLQGNLSDEQMNKMILRIAQLLEQNGDTLIDNFPIQIGSQGEPYYEKETDVGNFCSKFGIMEELSAKEVFSKLRNSYKIKEELSNEEARKILIVRNEIVSAGYKKYIPVIIAKDLSDNSVIAIEENSAAYPGTEIFSQVTRIYPNGNTASHVLGYLGKISDSEKTAYVTEKGYQASDLIGKEGIEKSYETLLKGRDGQEKVRVNASGDLVEVIEKREASKGKDITLTIDLNLQKAAEEGLKNSLAAMRTGSVYHGKYGSRSMKSAPNAETGAAVALDVKTGEVLAMASYPDFDPNLFVNGISTEAWNSLQSQNTRNPLAPAPLYNIAARSAVQPGSTFKMVTATAAIECGLDPQRRLYDNGYIRFQNNTFGCVVWNLYRSKHGYLNLQEALEVSCNYYFFDAVTGKDFTTGADLGYKKKMDIQTLMNYASQYGLGEPTGIEIPETITPAPTAERKISQLKASLKNTLEANLELYFDQELINRRQKLDQLIEEIIGWIGRDLTLNELRDSLSRKKGVREDQVNALADLCFYSYMNQATWNVGDALNLAIGQGSNSYTPLQMANYTATLGNGGVRNQISLIRAVEGRKNQKKEPVDQVKVSNPDCFNEIIGGMVKVANGSRGSLTSTFAGFPVTVAAKTGTAERSGKINPPDEVAYVKEHLGGIAPQLRWSDIEKEMERLRKAYPDIYTTDDTAVRRALMNLSEGHITAEKIDRYKSDYDNFAWVVAMAPAEDPEIAVAVMIPQGATAANAGPVAKEILGEYFASKE